MNSFLIYGKSKIKGKVKISGNKNAALPCLAASLLTTERLILKNIPEIEDVKVMISLLEECGSKVTRLEPNTYEIYSKEQKGCIELSKKAGLLRASILLAGSFSSLKVDLILPPPGGDVIGYRRLDQHFKVLEKLGTSCGIDDKGCLFFKTIKKEGSYVFLEQASVTATENAILAAIFAEGTTELYNIACEPHIQDLCKMLNAMGSNISGIGSNLLKIEGKTKLSGCTYTIGPDYMEAGSFIGLAAASKGELLLENVNIKDIEVIRSGFKKLGIEITKKNENSIFVGKQQTCFIEKTLDQKTIKIDDAPWPGFPTDLLSILIVVATQMKGTVLIHEKMFESRLYFVDWLIRMGADIIQCDPHRVVVHGPSLLKCADLTSPDVRAGMALLIASICAEGKSKIQNIYQIERGYENICEKLENIGVQIKRV
ncbi:MAG: UDP-N-acetylglucosamine 1-carboxyvinyltransferase [Sphaerochaetaceae bacterium]|nr:UDP-N-acetylglucosamine 1-carboxyvinyltransferase [Sphaerochaetaceae bacterium]